MCSYNCALIIRYPADTYILALHNVIYQTFYAVSFVDSPPPIKQMTHFIQIASPDVSITLYQLTQIVLSSYISEDGIALCQFYFIIYIIR